MTAPALRFAPLLWAEGASNFGSMLSRLAIPWLATLGLDASTWAMGWLLVAQVGSGAVTALVLAPWLDRANRRSAMLLADGGCAIVLALLAAAAATEVLSMPLLVLAATATGALATVFDMARSAWIGTHVPPADLPRCNAQLSAVGSVSETLAFAGGGWLFQWAGAVTALAVDAGSYGVSAMCVRRLDIGKRPMPQTASRALLSRRVAAAVRAWWADTRGGWRALAADPRLRVLAAIEALVSLGGAIFGACFMVYVTRTLAFEPGLLGMIFALGALGALAGAALAPAVGRRLGSGGAMAVGLVLLAIGNLAPVLAPGVGWAGVGLLVAQQIVGDSGQVLHEVHGRSLRQSLPDPAMLARVDGGLRSAGHLVTVLGALGGGAAAQQWGERPVLAFAAVCALWAAGLAALKLPGRGEPHLRVLSSDGGGV